MNIIRHTDKFCHLCGVEMNVMVDHPYDDSPYDEPSVENLSSLEFPKVCAFCAVTRREEAEEL